MRKTKETKPMLDLRLFGMLRYLEHHLPPGTKPITLKPHVKPVIACHYCTPTIPTTQKAGRKTRFA